MINVVAKFCVVCFLLIGITKSYASNDQKHSNVIELLTAFSGEDARKYQQYFKYSDHEKIVDVEIYVFGNDSTTARYTDEPLPWKQVNNILRIITADGYEAISGVDTYDVTGFSVKHYEELKSIAVDLKALKTLDPVRVMAILTNKYPHLSNEVRASVDIALWDLAARKAGLPLHKLLGSKRRTIEPYASLRFYDTLPEYIEAVNEYAKLGYTIFKFHVWGQMEKDLSLLQAVRQNFADTHYKFMIDFEYAYDLDGALKLSKIADEKLFILFEGLIDDKLLEQSAVLKRELPMAIIPAGYDNYSAEFIRKGIEKDAWDAGRFDVTVVGGLSQALELMIIADDAELPIEMQSWGHSLGQVANLHLMLANDRTRYFEAPMPKDIFEFGMLNGNLLTLGEIAAPEEPGLGIKVDWDILDTADFYHSSR